MRTINLLFRNTNSVSGFTLIELIMVIVLVGILAVVVGPLLSKPFQIYQDSTNRAQLVRNTQIALDQLVVDVKKALPNSVRVANNLIEFTPVKDGGRYREGPAGNVRALGPSQPDQRFNVLGDLAVTATDRIVVYNTNVTDFYDDAANNNNPGVISQTGITTVDCGVSCGANVETEIDLGYSHQFDDLGSGSPQRRLFVVNQPTTYACDLSNGRLLKFSNYGFNQALQTDLGTLTSNAATTGVLIEGLVGCQISFDPGSLSRYSIINLRIIVSNEGSSMSLFRQIGIGNTP